MIPLSQLEEMFSSMRTKTNWDVDGDMLWGYFFMDPSQERLGSLREELERMAYAIVDLYQSDDGSTFVLHVERVETHSPTSLFTRNESLELLASRFGIASYDGMDVGPVAKKPNLSSPTMRSSRPLGACLNQSVRCWPAAA